MYAHPLSTVRIRVCLCVCVCVRAHGESLVVYFMYKILTSSVCIYIRSDVVEGGGGGGRGRRSKKKKWF